MISTIAKRQLLAMMACSLLAADATNRAWNSLADTPDEDLSSVYLAAIYDTSGSPWFEEIFNFTTNLLNNHSDGFHDDVLPNGTEIRFEFGNGKCSEDAAVRAYWDSRIASNGRFVHGVIGGRCSSESISIARIAGLEGIPQVSPFSTSYKLSDKAEFPLFSRLAAPDNSQGEVGAVIAMLHKFGWDRVSILSTNDQFSKDFTDQFRQNWKGEVAFTNTISFNSTGSLDEDSVERALSDAPTDDPTVNSRVIVIAALVEKAYPILRFANKVGFQPDTIWVGLSWAAEPAISIDGLPDIPGYLGVAPKKNRDAVYLDYLERLRKEQVGQGREPWDELNYSAIAFVADSIISLAKALSVVPVNERHNGTLVTSALRSLKFDGVSGPVSFTEEGDRNSPQFTIRNFQKLHDGVYDWVDIGSTGTESTSTELTNGFYGICFATIGCNESVAPSDRYQVPKTKAPLWTVIVLPLILALSLGLAIKYWRSRKSKREKLTAMQKKMLIDNKLMGLDQDVSSANRKKRELILERGALMEKPDTWSDSDNILVEVSPHDDQYWTVADRLKLTMKDAHISKLWRIQNTPLWSYFSFHKDRLAMNGIDSNETAVWHGTSSLDPGTIYSDPQDGFMMQYSRDGFWGRGLYFAEKSAYSDSYAYKPALRPKISAKSDGRSVGAEDEREMFLAKLLKGNVVMMNRDESARRADECRALTVPPFVPGTQLKHNTVTGHTGDSQVFVVYENGRAYPDYLVRYYRGTRDRKRTLYNSKSEIKLQKQETMATLSDSSGSVDLEVGDGAAGKSQSAGVNVARGALWAYSDDNSVWTEYSSLHQATIEKAYIAFQVNPALNTVKIHSDQWTYAINLDAMVQTNIEHAGRKERAVRRLDVF